MVAKSVFAMKPRCILMIACQRFGGTLMNRNMTTAEFHSVERVPSCLLNPNVSRDSCDANHTNVACPKRHYECDGVVGSNVGVDQEDLHERV